MTVSDLTQGAEYYFTVAGVDTGGRKGEKSVPSQTFMRNSKCSPKLKHETPINVPCNV